MPIYVRCNINCLFIINDIDDEESNVLLRMVKIDTRPGALAEIKNGDQLLTGVNVKEDNHITFLLWFNEGQPWETETCYSERGENLSLAGFSQGNKAQIILLLI